MKRTQQCLLVAGALSLAGCAGGYTSAAVVYSEPAEYVYVVPVDRVVVVTREVLVNRGWAVVRVERSGPNRIIWARRNDNDDEIVPSSPRRRVSRSPCAGCGKSASDTIAANTRGGRSVAPHEPSSRTSTTA